MSLKLKVKICTLAAESKIIRTQQQRLTHSLDKKIAATKVNSREPSSNFRELRMERKRHKANLAIIKMGTKPANIWPELQMHRRGIVRQEARAALLAYAFLRGVPYLTVEAKFHDGNKPDWAKVERNVLRFTLEPDERITRQRFAEWKDAHGQEENRSEGGPQATQAA